MANRPDGKSAQSERVTFVRPAAERIARVVRQVESGKRDSQGLGFGYRLQQRPAAAAVFRMATFTGAWAIDSVKTVTFKYKTTDPNTASVRNSLIDLPASGERNCAIAKEGTAWHLINWQWNVVAGATSAELTSTELRFDTVPMGALATASTATFTIQITTCATATA